MKQFSDLDAIDVLCDSKHNGCMNTPGDSVIHSPFHAGEQALQHDTGAFGTLSVAGPRVIRDHMPDQHRTFFEQPLALAPPAAKSGIGAKLRVVSIISMVNGLYWLVSNG